MEEKREIKEVWNRHETTVSITASTGRYGKVEVTLQGELLSILQADLDTVVEKARRLKEKLEGGE